MGSSIIILDYYNSDGQIIGKEAGPLSEEFTNLPLKLRRYKMELLNWLEMWYTSVCNGEWEEYYGIKIVTIDNPGWLVEIDISETELEGKNFPPFQVEKGENDWISCKVEDDKFIGAGDKTKLCDIIEVFKTWSEVK